jgi:hypothetical protein
MASINGNRVVLRIRPEGMRLETPTDCRSNQMALRSAAELWTRFWLLLKTIGCSPTKKKNSVYQPLPPLLVTLPTGTKRYGRDLTYNPRFVAWLMGLPPDWTSCERRVMGFAHWLQRMRIELSRMTSQSGTESP